MEKGTFKGNKFLQDKGFEFKHYLGAGAYGAVSTYYKNRAGVRKAEESLVAIKTVDLFPSEIHCIRTLREVIYLARLEHPNILRLEEVFIEENRNDSVLHIVLPVMAMDLGAYVEKYRYDESYIQSIMYQVICGMKYMHASNIVHRDLKPANILLTAGCEVKICDMGLARVCDSQHSHDGFLTEHVATRYYRAPEMLIQSKGYGPPADIFAVGCIMAQMYLHTVLVIANNYLWQLIEILKITGLPSTADMEWVQSKDVRNFIKSLRYRETKDNKRFTIPAPMPWRKYLAYRVDKARQTYKAIPNISISDAGQSLLTSILRFNPSKRPTAAQALGHDFFESYHDEASEPLPRYPFTFADELEDLTMKQLRDKTYELERMCRGGLDTDSVIQKSPQKQQVYQKFRASSRPNNNFEGDVQRPPTWMCGSSSCLPHPDERASSLPGLDGLSRQSRKVRRKSGPTSTGLKTQQDVPKPKQKKNPTLPKPKKI